MNRYFFHLILIVLTIALIFTACEKSNVSTKKGIGNTTTTNQYVYDEGVFESRYNDALDALNQDIILNEFAPTSPEESGFAVVPLDKEAYGVDAFAFLPVINRKLTDDEMLQLAHGMGRVSFEELISPAYSYIDERDTNRPYQENEYTNISYKTLGLYFNEGLRPSHPLTNNPKDRNPIYVKMPKNSHYKRFWIYPLDTMTEEQILQIIDIIYGKIPEAFYTPLPNQVQYDEVKEIVNQFIQDYRITDKIPDEIYPLYKSYRFEKSNMHPPDKWTVGLQFNCIHDYSIEVFPEDGELCLWARLPIGYYKNPSNIQREIENDGTKPTKEQLIAVVEEYVSQVLLKGDITIAKINECSSGKIKVTLSNDKSYRIRVENDLSISVFKADR